MRVPAGARLLAGLVSCLVCADAASASCDAPYTVDNLLGDLVTIEDLLRNGSTDGLGATATRLEQGLGCLDELLPTMIAGRAYRAVGAGLVASGDTGRGTAWLRTAAEIEQSFDYGLEDLPAEHPVRDAYFEARSAFGDPEEVTGSVFGPGTHYLDGRKLDAPRARTDRPHIYQLESDGVRSWLVEGNAFPEEVLTAAPKAEVADKGKEPKAGKAPKVKEPKVAKVKEPKPEKVAKTKDPKPEKVATAKEPKSDKLANKKPVSTTSGGAVVMARKRPPEKTPLMIGGGAVILGAGGLYAMALQRKGAFESATSEDEVLKLAKQANQMVLMSAAVLAVGTGTLTWGVILDGGAPLPSLSVRF